MKQASIYLGQRRYRGMACIDESGDQPAPGSRDLRDEPMRIRPPEAAADTRSGLIWVVGIRAVPVCASQLRSDFAVGDVA